MIKVAQFGEGNFLRSFVDLYFDTLNKEGKGPYAVSIIKPVTFGKLDAFVEQNNKYNIVLRGTRDGKAVEEIYKVDSLEKVISPFEDMESYINIALDPELKIVVSNTTEAGIQYNENDKMDDFEGITYPAKLTKFIYARYKANLGGLYFLPVELIENNADELYKCVDKYITLWNLGEDFRKFNNEQNFYCNTLVDRIVSGHPRDEATKKHLTDLLGYEDKLVSVGEPFGLWVVQCKGELNKLIYEGTHNIDVILTKDISYYKKRKVRVLNGSHTNLVPISLWYGKETVYDVMKDEKLSKFVQDTLDNDIIPFVSNDVNATKEFADQVHDRFMNPFLNHQLTSISLNSISKWKARDLPSFIDYYKANNKEAKYLTIGFAYLVNIYQRIYKKDDLYYVDLPTRTVEVKDDLIYLEYFKNHSVHDFIKDTSIWGVDLSTYGDFMNKVDEYLILINSNREIL